MDEQRTDKFISVFEGGHMAKSGTVLDHSLVSVDGLCADAPFFKKSGGTSSYFQLGLASCQSLPGVVS